jgi:transposase-like protein
MVGLSESQVSAVDDELDEMVAGLRSRPLDAGPYTFVWIDALTQKVRKGEGGCTVNVRQRRKRGPVPGDPGHRRNQLRGRAGLLAFLRGLAHRGLSGVALVTGDDHAGLVKAIGAVLPGAAWQRCRTHHADLRIMPTWRLEPLVAALWVAEGRHNQSASRKARSSSGSRTLIGWDMPR